ncbi:YopX family protein (plasmid) [Brevibacillus halotolerans]|nr:YopX family protein [Brevibacillus halotolerans]
MIPLEYRCWNGAKMLSVSKLLIVEQRVLAYCPINRKHYLYPLSTIQIMPYTGCVDKNNQKIYVGDVVLITHMLIETIPSYRAIVEWDQYRFVLRALDHASTNSFLLPHINMDFFGLDVMVIGDIYRGY